MTGQTIVLAGGVPWPPTVNDFFPPAIAPWGSDGYHNPWFTKITLMLWLSVAIIILYFLLSYRKPTLVPSRKQWIAESIYGFVRNNISVEMLGTSDGLRFAPYLATVFIFIFVMNLWGIIPFFQVSPNAHIAFPAVLALLTYVIFIYQGIRKHGGGYLKHALILPAPWFIQPILIPIEIFSTFIVRPFSLAVRLFANMFAGHAVMLLLISMIFIFRNYIILPVPVLGNTAFLAFELFIAAIQAFVFTYLTAFYIATALEEEH